MQTTKKVLQLSKRLLLNQSNHSENPRLLSAIGFLPFHNRISCANRDIDSIMDLRMID